jgi:hypothetical protein
MSVAILLRVAIYLEDPSFLGVTGKKAYLDNIGLRPEGV